MTIIHRLNLATAKTITMQYSLTCAFSNMTETAAAMFLLGSLALFIYYKWKATQHKYDDTYYDKDEPHYK